MGSNTALQIRVPTLKSDELGSNCISSVTSDRLLHFPKPHLQNKETRAST